VVRYWCVTGALPGALPGALLRLVRGFLDFQAGGHV
jgi:hypothetical protein